MVPLWHTFGTVATPARCHRSRDGALPFCGSRRPGRRHPQNVFLTALIPRMTRHVLVPDNVFDSVTGEMLENH
ncbi:MAG TPA: hypothetical protein VF115_04830, partial [Acidimicrobiia bacterium]